MKKLIFLGAAIFTQVLSAEQYVGLSGGPDFFHHTGESQKGQKVGYKIGGVYGYKFANGIRAEAEIAYRNGDKRTVYEYSDNGPDKKTHVSNYSMSYMANVSYDIGNLQMYGFTPFIGAGVGFCNNSFEKKTKIGDAVANRDKGKDDRFAYQLIAGAKYPVAEKLELSAEYKYFIGQYHGKNHSFSAALVRSF